MILNGIPTSEFALQRGLRQGDLLSPFLFIIVMEGLHVFMEDAIGSGIYLGINVGRQPLPISHLFYVDDVLFLVEWDENNLRQLINILKCFFLVSGLRLNLQKSNIIGVGVTEQLATNMAIHTGCGAALLPCKYLGVPIGESMTRISSWRVLIDRFQARLSTWKARMLSSGGRLTLIKSVLGNLGILLYVTFQNAGRGR